MWKTMLLGEICQIKNGNSIPTKTKEKKFTGIKGTPYIATKDISFEGEVNYENGISISDNELENFKITPKESILICAEGGSAGRKIAYIDRNCCFVNKLFSIKTSDEILSKYVFYYLKSNNFQSQFKKALTGLIGGVSLSKIKRFQIIFPESIKAQAKIIDKLDNAFSEIDKSVEENLKNSMNAKLFFESSRAALLSSSDNNSTERTLGSCCERVSVGHVGTTSEYYCRADEGVAFLRSQNVKPGKLELGGVQHITKDFHQKIKKSQLQPNDILVVRVGANRGDCCLVPNGIKEINCANIVFARPTEGYAPFLAHFCQSKEGQEKLMGMSTGAAQSVINTKSVANLKIPFPTMEKQKSIAERLDNLCQHCSDLASLYRKKSEQLISLKSAILVKELRSDSL